ncbi:MAG: hypothetical protein V1664_04720 [Candidatus Uhrbacteria bacterium]
MSHFSNLRDGELTELKRIMGEFFTAEQGRKINQNPGIMKAMFDTAMLDPVFRLIHGIWSPLDDVVAMAREYEGVTGDMIDIMLAKARDRGLFELFEAELPKSRLLAPVIVSNRESVPATLLFGRALMRTAHSEKYSEWDAAYANGVDDKRIKLIEGARTFVPNELALHIVDFGANWNRRDGTVLAEVQQKQIGHLADFEPLFAASQHPEWVRQMDGEKIPYAIMAALLLSVPDYDEWSLSPGVWRGGGRAELSGDYVDCRFYERAMPVRREPNKL